MGKVISIINQKGGVGKTTVTVNLGKGLVKKRKKVLLIDLDPQANLTSSLGVKHKEVDYTVYDLLKGKASFEQTVISVGDVDLIPSSTLLAGADVQFSNIQGKELLLGKAILNIKEKYDGILLDCSPGLGLVSINALAASDGILIPIQAQYLSLEGVSLLVETIEDVKTKFNPNLKIEGIIINMYDSRQKLQKEVIQIIREYFKDKLFNTCIRNNVALAEAPSFGQDIFSYRQDSSGAIDYTKLCKELIDRGVI